MIRLSGLVIVAILAAHSAAAEIRMEERDGVLYVKNVEPPPPHVTPPPAASLVTRPATRYGDLIRAAAARYGLASELVESVIRVESNFEPRAVSPRGARGLMQLMPSTAALLGVRNVFDPRENIEAGVRHLRALLDRFGNDLALVLAAYNAGEHAVASHGGIPPYRETREYIAQVLSLIRRSSAATLSADAVVEPALAAVEVREEPSDARAIYRRVTTDGVTVYSNVPPRNPATRAKPRSH